jgi:hypothetical protein
MSGPELHVKSGEIYTISARKHVFSRVIVEKGAVLLVPPRSRNFLLLDVSGDTIFGGILRYRDCIATAGGKNLTLSDRRIVSFEHFLSAVGGDGGSGGVDGRTDRAKPGKGARGTNKYGGGGGGNGFTWPGTAINGDDGDGYRAGQSHKRGGNGARAQSGRHGGLVAIDCGGSFDGTGGLFDLSGSDGNPGNKVPKNHLWSGGGGGAPGGDGGYLFVRAKNIVQEPKLIFTPGNGGKGGEGGGRSSSESGSRGEHGEEGFHDFEFLQ